MRLAMEKFPKQYDPSFMRGMHEKIRNAVNNLDAFNFIDPDSLGVSLGETELTAYRGDRGKTAYDHSQSTHQYLITNGVLAITASGNWNDYKDTGFFQGDSLTNQCPGSSWRFCTVMRHNDIWTSQIMSDFGGTGIYQRNQVNGVWGSWRQLDLALGELSTNAYRGDRGKIAYDHSVLTTTPHVTSTEKTTWNGKAEGTHGHAGHDVTVLGNRLTVDSDGKVRVNNTANRRAGMYGVYNAAYTGHVWSMGSAYVIPDDGSNFGTLYGIAYKHTNNTTGGTMAGGHQILIVSNGTAGVALGMAGNVWTSGVFTAKTTQAVDSIVAYSNAQANGYIKYESGLLICWGFGALLTTSSSSGGYNFNNTVCTYGHAFATDHMPIVVCGNYRSVGIAGSYTRVTSITQADLYLVSHSTTAEGRPTYMAVGRWK